MSYTVESQKFRSLLLYTLTINNLRTWLTLENLKKDFLNFVWKKYVLSKMVETVHLTQSRLTCVPNVEFIIRSCRFKSGVAKLSVRYQFKHVTSVSGPRLEPTWSFVKDVDGIVWRSDEGEVSSETSVFHPFHIPCMRRRLGYPVEFTTNVMKLLFRQPINLTVKTFFLLFSRYPPSFFYVIFVKLFL